MSSVLARAPVRAAVGVGPAVERDLRVALVLLPVFWVLGIDQFVWPALSVGLLVRALLARRAMSVPASLLFLALTLLLVVAASASAVVDSRFLTYARNAYVLTGGIAAAVLVAATHRSAAAVRATLVAVAVAASMASFAGALGSIGVEATFTSPMGRFVGPSAPAYLQSMVAKAFVHNEASWFAEGFLRPRGLMLYPNLLAGAAAIALVVKFAAFRRSRPALQAVLVASGAIDVGVLVATLSRSGWLAFGVAAAIVFVSGRTTYWTAFARLLTVVLAAGVLAFTSAGDIVATRLFEKGHSNEVRLETYVRTLDAVGQDARTLSFGHGTQQDAATTNIPLGSHSTYLGWLYKHGLVGLALFVAVLFAAVWHAWRAVRRAPSSAGADDATLVLALLVVFVVQGAFIEIDVDATYAMWFWVVLGLAFAIGGGGRDRFRARAQVA